MSFSTTPPTSNTNVLAPLQLNQTSDDEGVSPRADADFATWRAGSSGSPRSVTDLRLSGSAVIVAAASATQQVMDAVSDAALASAAPAQPSRAPVFGLPAFQSQQTSPVVQVPTFNV